MAIVLRFLFILLIAATAAAVEPINAIVAVVNDDAITELEVAEEARRIAYDTDIGVAEARQRALESLINRHLQLQRADARRIDVPDEIVQERLDELAKELGAEDEQELQRIAQERFFMSYPQFIERVRNDIRIQSLYYRELYSKARVYEDEIDQYLRTETAAGARRQYRLGHILILKNGDDDNAQRTLAQQVRERALAGEDFVALAAEYGDDEQTAADDAAFQYEEDLPQVFLETVRGLNVGGVGDLVETSRGFHVLKLLARRGGALRDKVERVRLSHIFLPPDAQAQARDIRRRLREEGLDFAVAAREYSTDRHSLEDGGDLGWFADNDLSPYFTAAVAGLRVGEVSEPTRSPYGWHLVLIADRRTDSLDMDLMRDRARRVLRDRRAIAQREIWLQQIRGEAYVHIFSAEFAAVGAP